jgi:hypothetical protein
VPIYVRAWQPRDRGTVTEWRRIEPQLSVERKIVRRVEKQNTAGDKREESVETVDACSAESEAIPNASWPDGREVGDDALMVRGIDVGLGCLCDLQTVRPPGFAAQLLGRGRQKPDALPGERGIEFLPPIAKSS